MNLKNGHGFRGVWRKRLGVEPNSTAAKLLILRVAPRAVPESSGLRLRLRPPEAAFEILAHALQPRPDHRHVMPACRLDSAVPKVLLDVGQVRAALAHA